MKKNQQIDEMYMQRCIELANLGKGHVQPNPMVGCVIVHNGRIIGEGYHQKYGGPHAEVNAIASVKNQDLLTSSTLYVNLEPCSHYGKTPPCVDLILEKQIPQVVIGIADPHEKVAGKSITKLNDVGVQVTTDILPDKCHQLNKRFITYHRQKRPFVVLKWAQSRDGFIDIERDPDAPTAPTWISNEISRTLVHKWRTEEQAIMVGTNTALKDNPSLNIRDWHGPQPLRIVLDRNLRLPGNLAIMDGKHPTWVFNEKKDNQVGNITYRKISFENPAPEMIQALYNQGFISLLVEGGRRLLQSFVDTGIWDEARVFIGDRLFHKGVKAPKIEAGFVKDTKFDEDTLFIYKNHQLNE